MAASITPPAGLEHMLMYRLYRAWSQASPVFVRLCEGRFGITRREWRLLATSCEQGVMTSAGLATAARLDLVRTSRCLGSLCEKGWLTRRTDDDDARIVWVQPSEQGLELYRELMPEISQLNDVLADGLDQEDKATLLRLLQQLEQRGAQMTADNLVADKASRRDGGTRRRPASALSPATLAQTRP